MQHSHILRATVCAACLLTGGAAFAQGAAGAQGANVAMQKGGFTPVALTHHAGHSFSSGRMRGNIGAHNIGGQNFNTAGNRNGARGGYGGGWGGGWGPGYAAGGAYPDGYGSDDPGYAYDHGYGDPGYAYDNGYPYDNGYGPGVYAQGEPGSYCQTPENSCGLDQPSLVGAACQCRNGFDQVPGTVQP